jgi:hypothetical protein
MSLHLTTQTRWGLLLFCGTLLASAAWADRPEGAGQGKRPHMQEQRMQEQRMHDDRPSGEARAPREAGQGSFFEPRHQQAARDIYGPQVAKGKCPPGLAKKGNGCLPPGQARPWAIGRPLPADVVLYPVPFELQRRLGPPPAGYKYVRAASDILLIAIGTSMVIDAIEDLGGL